MSSTHKTTYYELPQFVDSDMFNPLVDDNDAYDKIDTALHNIAEAEAYDASEIADVKNRVTTVEGKVDDLETQNGSEVLTTTAETLSGAVNELDSDVVSLNNRLDVVEDDIDNVNTGLKVKVDALERQNGNEELSTTAQTLSGAINEIDRLIKGAYITPEQYGAVGNGVTDDTAAIEMALEQDVDTVLLSKVYAITSAIDIPSGKNIVGLYAGNDDITHSCINVVNKTSAFIVHSNVSISGIVFNYPNQHVVNGVEEYPYTIVRPADERCFDVTIRDCLFYKAYRAISTEAVDSTLTAGRWFISNIKGAILKEFLRVDDTSDMVKVIDVYIHAHFVNQIEGDPEYNRTIIYMAQNTELFNIGGRTDGMIVKNIFGYECQRGVHIYRDENKRPYMLTFDSIVFDSFNHGFNVDSVLNINISNYIHTALPDVNTQITRPTYADTFEDCQLNMDNIHFWGIQHNPMYIKDNVRANISNVTAFAINGLNDTYAQVMRIDASYVNVNNVNVINTDSSERTMNFRFFSLNDGSNINVTNASYYETAPHTTKSTAGFTIADNAIVTINASGINFGNAGNTVANIPSYSTHGSNDSKIYIESTAGITSSENESYNLELNSSITASGNSTRYIRKGKIINIFNPGIAINSNVNANDVIWSGGSKYNNYSMPITLYASGATYHAVYNNQGNIVARDAIPTGTTVYLNETFLIEY